MRKIFIILGILLLSGFVLSMQSVYAKEIGYISVHVTETKDIAPNVATIIFGVETTDVDSKRAVERNNQISSKLVSALKNELTSDKNAIVQTKNFNLRPNYKNNETDVKTVKNYTAINSVEVKTTDVSKVSALIDIAVKNNVSNVNSLNFSLENEDAFSTELINSAVDKARNIAKKAALAANQKLGSVKTMRVNVYQQTSNGTRLYKTYASADGASVSETSTPVEAGKIKLNATVDVDFFVK